MTVSFQEYDFRMLKIFREGGQHEKLGRDIAENEVGRLGSTTVSIVIETTGKKTGEAEACDEASDGRHLQKINVNQTLRIACTQLPVSRAI